MGNQEWTIQRYWQHYDWTHKTQDEDKQKTTHNKTLKTKKISNIIKLCSFIWRNSIFFCSLNMDFIMCICMSLDRMYICIMVSCCLFVRQKQFSSNFTRLLIGDLRVCVLVSNFYFCHLTLSHEKVVNMLHDNSTFPPPIMFKLPPNYS
jgi:hypothetical protein